MNSPYTAIKRQQEAEIVVTRVIVHSGLVRPAITPPSTSQTAPVTQEALSDNRKQMVSATSMGLPMRPIGWNLSNPCNAALT